MHVLFFQYKMLTSRGQAKAGLRQWEMSSSAQNTWDLLIQKALNSWQQKFPRNDWKSTFLFVEMLKQWGQEKQVNTAEAEKNLQRILPEKIQDLLKAKRKQLFDELRSTDKYDNW